MLKEHARFFPLSESESLGILNTHERCHDIYSGCTYFFVILLVYLFQTNADINYPLLQYIVLRELLVESREDAVKSLDRLAAL